MPDVADRGAIADLIGGLIGDGSQFDLSFGYCEHGVDANNALLPRDWRDRAHNIQLPTAPGICCICPDINDLALSTVCAWRDKDIEWLRAGLRAGILDLRIMTDRSAAIDDQRAPASAVMAKRLEILRCTSDAGSKPPPVS